MPNTRKRFFAGRAAVRAAVAVAAVMALASPAAVAGPRIGAGDPAAVIVRGPHAAEAVRQAGGRVTFALPIVDGVAARVPSGRVAELRALGLDVTPDERVHVAADTSGETNASTIKSVFALETNAAPLWLEGVTGKGVRVAIVDTGVAAVPDLADRLVKVPDPTGTGVLVDCVDLSGENSCADSYGHGTFVAGLIAGTGVSSAGAYRGVAPDAEIVPVKIAGRDGSADVSKVLAAIQWVVSFGKDLNIRVLNLSLGTNSRITYRIDPLNFAVERAWRAGITVVVSAGNHGPGARTISKPADDPLVVTVGAVDDRETPAISDDRLPKFSSRGPTFTDLLAKPDVVAPGGRVISLRSPGSFVESRAPGGGIDSTYRRGSGTSMSAAIVSGLTALVLQANPAWTPDRVKFALTSTAHKVAERDPAAIGYGLVDAYAAARLAPPGLANQNVFTLSDGTGALDGSRGDVKVSRACRRFEELIDPNCDHVHGDLTGQDKTFDPDGFRNTDWTGSSWYESQWLGSSWYGSSWYGSSWYGSSWYGSSWYGSEDATFYGASMSGSSWYGAWQ